MKLVWGELTKNLGEMTEEELRTAINVEVSTTRRDSYMLRMHQRFSKLRAIRERDELKRGGLLL